MKRLAVISGIHIHYELHEDETKKKPIIVLLHGFLSSLFSYRRLIPLLKKDFTVLAVDLPPFGGSDKTKNFIYSYQNMAGVVLKLLEEFNYTNVTLVGHSMGGQICLYMAKEKPLLIQRIVLLCSSGYQYRMKKTFILTSYLPFFRYIIKRRLEKQGVKHNLLNVVHNHSLIDQEMIDGYTEPFLDNRIFMALTRMIRDREGDLPSEELKKIKAPILLIWGENDRVVPVSVGTRLHHDLPYSTFRILPHTGHLVPEERPQEVYQEITHFLKEATKSGR